MHIGMSNDHPSTHSNVACFIDQDDGPGNPVPPVRIIVQGLGCADADPSDFIQGEGLVIVVLLECIDVDLERKVLNDTLGIIGGMLQDVFAV